MADPNTTIPPRSDGLHCVYGTCKGPPHGPNMTCHPGCCFQGSSYDPLRQMVEQLSEPPMTYAEAVARYPHAPCDTRVHAALFAEIERLRLEVGAAFVRGWISD